MRLCVGAGNYLYCCPHPDGSEQPCVDALTNRGYTVDVNEGVCFANAVRVNYSVRTKDMATEYYLYRLPYLYFDSSITLTFIAKPELILSLFTILANNTPQITKIQVGDFVVPTEIKVATFLDDCSALLSLDTYIVTSVNIGQRGGSLIELEIRGVRKSSFELG